VCLEWDKTTGQGKRLRYVYAPCAWLGLFAAFFMVVLACSRIFWIWALRLGLAGRGGGGMALGRVRRVRCRVLRFERAVVRAGSVGGEGLLMALLEGSMCRGRRVNVWSMMAGREGSGGDGRRLWRWG